MQQQEINHLLSELKQENVKEEDVAKAVNSLSREQKQKFDEAMKDPQKLKTLMNSPLAKELMKHLKG